MISSFQLLVKRLRPCGSRLPRLRVLAWGLALLLIQPFSVSAVEVTDYVVQVSARVRDTPPQIVLEWPAAGDSSGYQVQRKLASATAWGTTLATLPGSATAFVDSSVSPGVAYEYRVTKTFSAGTGYGYVATGIELPLVDSRGKIILVVETSMADLTNEIALLERNLVGDGWQVLRLTVARTVAVPTLKSQIVNLYQADPANVRALLLLGHLPVPYSGDFAPDDHAEHKGAWAADVYYGDVNGLWTDNTVNSTGAARPENRNRPNDGKFDQSYLPSDVELQVGRVDFANLPLFNDPSLNEPQDEKALLRQYLNKNHRYRHKRFTLPGRGLIDDNFGVGTFNEAFAADGWRTIAAFYGASNVLVQDFFTTLTNQGCMWAYAAGAGVQTGAQGVGTSSYFLTNDVKVAFTMLFGSNFIDWDYTNNFLRSALASRSYTLTSSGSGMPHWFYHHMAIGEPIGYSTRLSQNNTNFYPGLRFQRGVHVALMGDPTLRLHVVAPPSELCAATNGLGGFNLSWQPSPEVVLGYHVYRGDTALGPFNRLTTTALSATSFRDSSVAAKGFYMVRAVRLETQSGASYYNASQGIFPENGPVTRLVSPVANQSFQANASITLEAYASSCLGLRRVEFYQGAARTKIGERASPPYTLTWANVPAGTYPITVKAIDFGSRETWSEPVTIRVGPPPESDYIWFDDRTPPGAIHDAVNDAWNWVSDLPAPLTGRLAHQSSLAPGLHKHLFYFTGYGLPVSAGDVLYAYVYLDPVNPPEEVMLEWNAGSGIDWEHRAYWGNNLINLGINGNASRRYMGPLPPLGQWVRLSVPANQVNLENTFANGMSFTLYGGRATWDRAGKSAQVANRPPSVNVTAPEDGSFLVGPTNLLLKATAWDADGSVALVRFYVNGNYLGQVASAPYTLAWPMVRAGVYQVTAQAQDNSGAVTMSVPVEFTVEEPPMAAPPLLLAAQAIAQGIVLRITSDTGLPVVVESGTILGNWATWGSYTNRTGLLLVTNPVSGANQRFFRVRSGP